MFDGLRRGEPASCFRRCPCLLESLARRYPSSLELMREIGALKDRGYTNTSPRKSTSPPDYTAAICYLIEHGEEGLFAAVERGVMPAGIGMEIALPVSRSSFHGQLIWINESSRV